MKAPGFADLVVDRRGVARFRGRRLGCSIGRGGIRPAAEKREGDGATPAGVWRLEAVYRRPDRPGPERSPAKPARLRVARTRPQENPERSPAKPIRLRVARTRPEKNLKRLNDPVRSENALKPLKGWRPILPWMRWSDDPRDPAYNDLRRENRFSAERMRRGDRMYDLVGVIDHNRRPVEPGAGSAVFLHLHRGPRRPTAGCLAFRRADLEWILRRWSPRGRVVIRA